MIVGRDAQIAELVRRLQAGAACRGGVIGVRGPAGTGKTALLDAVRERVPAAHDLAARGVQTETELPFDTLAELLTPLLHLADALPARQAAALRSALAVGPDVGGDRLAVAVATLGVLLEAAKDGPVHAFVDDVHWVDTASADCLAFVARRLPGTPVSLVLSYRDDERVPAWLDDIDAIGLGPLDEASATQLAITLAPDASAVALERVLDVAAGNPLAITEVLGALTSDERCGKAPLPELLRHDGRFGSVFARRIETLDAPERSALLICAAARTDAADTLSKAIEAGGGSRESLVHLADSGLLRITGAAVEFAHPLVRSTAYYAAADSERRAAHRLLAGTVPEDEAAWHRASAAVGADDAAAQALDELATTAARRSAYGIAARALETAARLTTEGEVAAGRLARAADMSVHANLAPEETIRLLDQAQALRPSPALDLHLLRLRGIVLHRDAAELAATHAMLAAASERARPLDAALSATLLAQAAYCALVMGDCESTRRHAEAAAALLAPDSPADAWAPVLATLAAGRAYRGEPERAAEALGRLNALAADVSPGTTALAMPLALQTLVGLGHARDARAIADFYAADSRSTGSLTALPFLLTTSADAAYRLGDWDATEREAEEALVLARETHQSSVVCMASCVLARLFAATGRDDEAELLVDEVLAFAQPRELGSQEGYALAALGLLMLGRGDVERARDAFDRLDRRLGAESILEPTMMPWRPDAIEAHLMAGDRAAAERQLRVLEQHAAPYSAPLARALVARCRGLVADDGFEEHFEAAIAAHDAPPGPFASSPFERARSALAYGARLHRARRRSEARAWLRQAIDGFAALGAVPWSQRAESELAAAGGRQAAVTPAETGELNERERRVAEAVAQGLSNREVAAVLFISVKTVEFHLGKVYRKLGVRNRTQLAARLHAG